MTRQPIDPKRRAAKHERAGRRGGDLFLFARAFADCAERIALLTEQKARMLVATAPGMEWTAADCTLTGASIVSLAELEPGCADLIVAVGAIDHADDPALAAFVLAHALSPGGRLLGAALGSRSLARLRGALIDAERQEGRAVQRVHPLPDSVALAGLLAEAGLREVVVDVDPVEVGYRSFDRLVADLRDMGGTNSLAGDVPRLRRGVTRGVAANFMAGENRVTESFEILHFSAVSGNVA